MRGFCSVANITKLMYQCLLYHCRDLAILFSTVSCAAVPVLPGYFSTTRWKQTRDFYIKKGRNLHTCIPAPTWVFPLSLTWNLSMLLSVGITWSWIYQVFFSSWSNELKIIFGIIRHNVIFSFLLFVELFGVETTFLAVLLIKKGDEGQNLGHEV